MASQDPSTAYTAAPEKKSGSFFSSFSLPKLPDFFGSTTPAAPAAAPAPSTAIAAQSSVQPGGRRRRGSKKAGRRRTRRFRRGGDDGPPSPIFTPEEIRSQTKGTKAVFLPSQVRKGKGRRTRRVKKHSRR